MTPPDSESETLPERLEQIYQAYFAARGYDMAAQLSLLAKSLDMLLTPGNPTARPSLDIAASASAGGRACGLLEEIAGLAAQCGLQDELARYRDIGTVGRHRAFIDQVNDPAGRDRTVVLVAKIPYFVLLRTALYLRRKGYRVFLLTLSPLDGDLRALFEGAVDDVAAGIGSHYVLRQIMAALRPTIVHAQMWMLSYELCRLVVDALPDVPVICEFYDVTSIYAPRRELTRVWSPEVVDFDLAMERYVMRNAAGILSRYPKWVMENWAGSYDCSDQLLGCNHAYPLPEYRRSKSRDQGRGKKRRRLVYAGGLISAWLDPELFPEAYMALAFRQLLAQGFTIDVIHDPHRPVDENPVYAPFRRLAEMYPGFRLVNGVPPDKLPALLQQYDFGILLTHFPERLMINPDQKAGVVATKIYAYLEAGIPIIVNAEYLEMARIAVEHGVGIAVQTKQIGQLARRIDALDYESALNKVDSFNRTFGMDRQIDGLVAFYEAAKQRRAALGPAGRGRPVAASSPKTELLRRTVAFFKTLSEEKSLEGETDQALLCLDQCFELTPNASDVAAARGRLLESVGRFAEAAEDYRRCLARSPDLHDEHERLMRLQIALGTFPADSVRRDAQRPAARLRRRELPARRRQVRVGMIVSAGAARDIDLTLCPFLDHHDPAALELHCFQLGELDLGRAAGLKARAAGWHVLDGSDPDKLALATRRRGIDIAVGLAGYNTGDLLQAFVTGLAPRQAIWSTAPVPTGSRDVGFVLTDWATVPMADERIFTEAVLRVPGRAWARRPAESRPPDPPPSANQTFTFLGDGSAMAVTPEVAQCWARIMSGADGTRLRVAVDRSRPTSIAILRAAFRDHGVDPGRLAVAEGDLAATDGDLYLDAFPGGLGIGLTRFAAAGIPAVSLAGAGLQSRIAASILSAMGLSQLAPTDPEGYVQAAVAFARGGRDAAARRREVLWRFAASDVCDGAAMTRGIEGLLSLIARAGAEERAPA